MLAHRFKVASTPEQAVEMASVPGARLLAGGTNQIDHMKVGIDRPTLIVDISTLKLSEIEECDGFVRYGTLASNTAAAEHSLTRSRLPLISMCIAKGATQQIRNMASLGGNLLQGVRCGYFYDLGSPCNRRDSGGGCAAIGGIDRMNAVLGTSTQCTAANPSDMALAMVVYEARLNLLSPRGPRTLSVQELHRQPGDTPWITNNLLPGEMILSIDVPLNTLARNSAYVKVRDRQSYAFATVSAAVALDVVDGTIRDARIAAGGVGTVPWRFPQLEAALRDQSPDEELFASIAKRATEGAVPGTENAFKLQLLPQVICRALTNAVAGTPANPVFFE